MSDIQSIDPTKHWLVAGWFTPDYRPLAETFAANLAEHRAPYHLWAKPSLGGWSADLKPSVVLETMDAYPGKAILLMDVDCIVRGDIAPMAAIEGDAAMRLLARNTEGFDVSVFVSSRVMAFRPTDGARNLVMEWERFCKTSSKGDENALTWAYLSRSEGAYSQLDRCYAGIEITEASKDCIIVHRAAHNTHMRQDGALQTVGRWLKAIERPFRTGRTRRFVKRIG